MGTEAMLRAAMRDRPHDTTPRLVLADHLEDLGRYREAALHRVIAEPHNEDHVARFASSMEGHSVLAHSASHTAAGHSRSAGYGGGDITTALTHATHARMATAPDERAILHESAATSHRASVEVHLHDLDHTNHPDWRADLYTASEQHRVAAAVHTAAAYHHRNSPDVPS